MYAIDGGRLRFRQVPPTHAPLEVLVTCISERIGRLLERHGLLVRDLDHSYLNVAETKDDAAMEALRGHFIPYIPYRIALGPQEGHKAFTLQTLPVMAEDDAGAVAKAALTD